MFEFFSPTDVQPLKLEQLESIVEELKKWPSLSVLKLNLRRGAKSTLIV